MKVSITKNNRISDKNLYHAFICALDGAVMPTLPDGRTLEGHDFLVELFEDNNPVEILKIINPGYMTAGMPMEIISQAYVEMLNNKLNRAKTKEELEKVEEESQELREGFKEVVDQKRAEYREKRMPKRLASQIYVKNRELLHYHHSETKHKEGHSYNPFASDENIQ